MCSDFVLHERLQQDSQLIGHLSLSCVLLMNDANYPWCILVPRRNNIQDIHQLHKDDQQQLIQESSYLSQVMMTEFCGDKMNVAALGNIVPQLHIHHIVRFKTDIAWPKPVWGYQPVKSYEQEVLSALVKRLQQSLAL